MAFGPKSKKRRAFKVRAAVRLAQALGLDSPADAFTPYEAYPSGGKILNFDHPNLDAATPAQRDRLFFASLEAGY